MVFVGGARMSHLKRDFSQERFKGDLDPVGRGLDVAARRSKSWVKVAYSSRMIPRDIAPVYAPLKLEPRALTLRKIERDGSGPMQIS
jgi:hypothetical protein